VPEVRESAGPASNGKTADHDPAEILDAAYPAEGERRHAIRWLVWLAVRMGEYPDLAWWEIPSWIGPRNLRFARTLIAGGTLGLIWTAVLAPFSPLGALGTGGVMALLGGFLSRRIRPGKLRREPRPQAMIPRRPRSGRELALVTAALVTGLPLRWVLRRLWARPVADLPEATPGGSYLACRRSTAIDMAACLLTGAPVAVASGFYRPSLLLIAGLLSTIAYLTALADGKVPAVYQAELYLLIKLQHGVRFHRLLEQATDRRVLRKAGPYYRFGDPAVRDYLTGIRQAALDERALRIAARKQRIADAPAGPRTWLLGLLAPNAILRFAMDLGCAGVIGAFAQDQFAQHQTATWRSAVLAGFDGGILAFPAVFILLTLLVRGLSWSLSRPPSPRTRVAVLAAATGVAGLVVLVPGPAAVRHGIAVAAVTLMPGLLVAVVGGWACVLVHRRWHGSRHRLVRHAADALLAAVGGTAFLLVLDRNLVGAQAAAVLLFPVAVWLSIRGWRAMNDSDQPAVRAVADIAVSLMLGGCLVLLLVWLANLLHMPAGEVAVLRGALGLAGAVIDWPWWAWTAVYVALAGLSLAFAAWPSRLEKLLGWFKRLRVVPSAEVTRRVLTGVHIGLLVVVLIGLAAPAATSPALRARLAARYTETLTDDLRARGELAVYQEIAREFGHAGPSLLTPLAELITRIDGISRPSDGKHGATGIELDLARRLGELQARTLAPEPPDVTQAEAAVTRQAGLDAEAGSAAQEKKQLGEVDAAEHEDDATEELVDQAAELAASAVAGALQLPGLGDTEVVQVIREYLSGLIEISPLKDVFAAWAGRITGRSEPPAAEELVIPDPGPLKDAAATAATAEVAKEPVTGQAPIKRFLAERAIVAAVDLTNQVRYLQEGGGPCSGCAQPEPSDDEPGHGSGDPLEPDFGF
jgi:hypothetical protein